MDKNHIPLSKDDLQKINARIKELAEKIELSEEARKEIHRKAKQEGREITSEEKDDIVLMVLDNVRDTKELRRLLPTKTEG